MRARALWAISIFCLLFLLLLTATRASGIPLQSASARLASTPVWSAFEPSAWVAETSVTCSIQVYNQDGLLPYGKYNYSTDGGATWSDDVEVTPDVQPPLLPTTATFTVPGLSFVDSQTPNQNQIQFAIKDNTGQWSWSGPNYVRVDRSAPSSGISSSGCYSSTWSRQIQGTATDAGSGVRLVEVTLRNGAGLYYNGSTWQATAVWLSCVGTDNWSYSAPALSAGTYTVASRATDWAGHIQPVPSQRTFTYDPDEPVSAVTTSGYDRAWPGTITGTSGDAMSGVARVQVAVHRALDDLWFDGTQWGAFQWITASGISQWSLVLQPPVETTYAIQSRATDNCGNVQTTFGQSSWTYDATPPTSDISTSGCYSSAWTGRIVGTAGDAGSGVRAVDISLRNSSGQYFDGSFWQATRVWLPASGANQWSYAVTLGEGLYSVQSRASDWAGNVQTAPDEQSFTYDAVEPQSGVSTAGNLSMWPGTITGSASDTTSGVARVQIAVRRAVDDSWYDGSQWGAFRWIVVTGTTNWSLPIQPPVETTYTIQSRAVDSCGNVQSVPSQSSFIYDATAPAQPTNISVLPSVWSKLNSFVVNWTNPADLLGITRAYYKWDAPPTSNSDQSAGSPASGAGIHSVSLTLPVQGSHMLYLWLGDAGGNANYQNWVATQPGAFRWDAAAPLTTIGSVTGIQGCQGWYTSNVQVELTAVDVNPNPALINETSGISATYWRKDSGGWTRVLTTTFVVSGEGPHSVEYYSDDHAGNQEPPKTLTPQIKIDSIPPTSSAPSYTGTGRNGWYTSTVTVGLSAADTASGVSTLNCQVDANPPLSFQGSSASFVVADDGVHTIAYSATDVACNREATRTSQLKIDKTAPTTVHQLDGLQGENGWFVASPVAVVLSASDPAPGIQSSGLDALWYRIDNGSWLTRTQSASLTISGEGIHVVQYYATDLAGNIEPTKAFTVGIDLTPPGSIIHVPIVSPPSWSNINCFDVSWWNENPSDTSGIAGAYYSFHEPSTSTDGTLVPGDNIMSLSCIQVPAELGDGAHNLHIWLRDKAGRSDQRTRRTVTLRIDRIAPTPDIVVSGSLCGTMNWYNSCITATFVATDVHSGMASGVISYQVNSAGWTTGNSYTACDDKRYTLETRAMDRAGNVSAVVTSFVKLDRTAPPSPADLRVDPAGWTRNNAYALTWSNPGDFSGLAGVYYKLGSLPASPTDGVYVDGILQPLVVSTTLEGETPIYVWLVDKACNADHTNRALGTLRYDRTPPTTTATPSGSMGGDGWYISPVQVSLSCTDGGSQCSSSKWRLGNGLWQTGSSFSITSDGTITFSYYSVDNAGNAENALTSTVKIDQTPPASYAYADSYSRSTSFTVYWDGSDLSSGIASFDVQSREGVNGTWKEFVTSAGPSQKSALFTGASAGKTYYFRSRSSDRAGNLEAWPSAPDAYVSVDPVVNGSFEPGDWSGWERGWIAWPGSEVPGQCQASMVLTQSFSGGDTHAVLLGCPNLRNGAPIGMSVISQTIDVPNSADMPAPTLIFRYRVYTYDMVWSQRYNRYYDSFNVGLRTMDSIQPTWVYTDGNKTQDYDRLMDLGWHEGAVDLRPYAGRRVQFCLANATRVDSRYNTWTVVDDVRVLNVEKRLYLPAIVRAARTVGMSAMQEHSDMRRYALEAER